MTQCPNTHCRWLHQARQADRQRFIRSLIAIRADRDYMRQQRDEAYDEVTRLKKELEQERGDEWRAYVT